jgi:WD40 repeat protein
MAFFVVPRDARQEWKAAVWDVAGGKELRTIALGITELGRAQWLALSPDGTRLAVLICGPWGGPNVAGAVHLWEIASGKELARFPTGPGVMNGGLEFSPDGRRVAVASSKDTSVKLREASSGELLLELTGLDGGNPFLAFSPDGTKLASAARDGRVLVWDISPGPARGSRPPMRVLSGTGVVLRGVAFSADGRRVCAVTVEGTILTWDVVPAERKRILREPEGQLDETAACSSCFAAAWHLSGNQTRIKVWDQTGRNLFSHTETAPGLSMVGTLVLSPDGSRVAYTAEAHEVKAGKRTRSGRLRVWEVATGRVVYSDDHAGRCHCFAFSADGRRLAVVRTRDLDLAALGSRIAVLDLDTGKEVFVREVPGYARLSFSPDGQRLAAGLSPSPLVKREGELLIWDIATGKMLVSRQGFRGWVAEPAWSADSSRLAVRAEIGGSCEMHLLAADSGAPVQAPFATHAQVQHAFSPDGQRLVTCGGRFGQPGEIKVWDATGGRELLCLPVTGCGTFAWGPDGCRLWCVSGAEYGHDVEVQVWDATPLTGATTR